MSILCMWGVSIAAEKLILYWECVLAVVLTKGWMAQHLIFVPTPCSPASVITCSFHCHGEL